MSRTQFGVCAQELLSWHAKNMLESHMHDKPGGTPFFLYLSLKSIHDPFQVRSCGFITFGLHIFKTQAPERHYDWHRQYSRLANRTLENRENERVSVLGTNGPMDLALLKSNSLNMSSMMQP